MSRREKLEQMERPVEPGQNYGHLHVRALVSVEEHDDHTTRIWLVECSAPRAGGPCGRQEEVRSSRLRFDGWTCCSSCRKAAGRKTPKERREERVKNAQTLPRGIRLTPEQLAALQGLIQEAPRRPPLWIVQRYESLHGLRISLSTVIRHREALGLRAPSQRAVWACEVRVSRAIQQLALDLPQLGPEERREARQRISALAALLEPA